MQAREIVALEQHLSPVGDVVSDCDADFTALVSRNSGAGGRQNEPFASRRTDTDGTGPKVRRSSVAKAGSTAREHADISGAIRCRNAMPACDS
jgi:hypothetical protein